MQLEFRSGLVIDDPTEADIRAGIRHEDYTILARSSHVFLQCARRDVPDPQGSVLFRTLNSQRRQARAREAGALPLDRFRWRRFRRREAWPGLSRPELVRPGQYLLEYQEGSLAEHYQATDESITVGRVYEAFCKYLIGDESWRADFSWRKLGIWEFNFPPSDDDRILRMGPPAAEEDETSDSGEAGLDSGGSRFEIP